MNTSENNDENTPRGPIRIDDPRLTALALGELQDEALLAEVESHPDLKREFDRIRTTAKSLTDAFAEEAREPMAQTAKVTEPASAPARKSAERKVIRFPFLRPSVYVPLTSIAAVMILVFGIRFYEKPTPTPPQPLDAPEVVLPAPGSAAAAHPSTTATTTSGNVATPTAQSGVQTVASTTSVASQHLPQIKEGTKEIRSKPSARAVAKAGRGDEVYILSPFMVSAETPEGYASGDTLAETRMQTELKDGGSATNGASRKARRDRYADCVNYTLASPCATSPEETVHHEEEVTALNAVRPLAPFDREGYDAITENSFTSPLAEPLSTFSVDVDTASYANVRRMLQDEELPPAGAVRIEELLNYFSYDYAPPADQSTPFAAHIEATTAPWAPKHELVRVALKGYEVPWTERPVSNLVFLVDVSGSMDSSAKLPLVKEGLKMLVSQLDARDRVAIVTYAGYESLALPSTTANNTETIMHAIDQLGAGGSTNGAGGIRMAYEQAQSHFVKDGINRVILCSDGDFNVGMTSRSDLVDLITEKAKSGVFLSVFGFGRGNLQDSTMEQLADKGNGNYNYVDSLKEARRLFVRSASGNFLTIAKDVKIQVEFNPAYVQAYRLIGYENRKLEAQDFNDDKKDAGEIGAGHAVTALYEVIPVGVKWENPASVDKLKYQTMPTPEKTTRPSTDELLTVKVRYKAPDGDKSKKLEFPLAASAIVPWEKASTDTRFASAVALFGMELRGSEYSGTGNLRMALDLASQALGSHPDDERVEFLDLCRRAKELNQAQENEKGTQQNPKREEER